MSADRRLILAVDATDVNAMAKAANTEVLDPNEMWMRGSFGAADQNVDALPEVCGWLSDCGLWWGPRRTLEDDPKFRQIIPYVVVHNGEQILTYTRGDDIEEERLRGAIAVGFGGHVDLEDAIVTQGQMNLLETIGRGAAREMFEELGMVTRAAHMDCIGLVVSSATEVSSVHLGIILMLELAGTVASKETSQHSLVWMTPEEILAYPDDKKEGWTEVVSANLRRYLDNMKPEAETVLVALP